MKETFFYFLAMHRFVSFIKMVFEYKKLLPECILDKSRDQSSATCMTVLFRTNALNRRCANFFSFQYWVWMIHFLSQGLTNRYSAKILLHYAALHGFYLLQIKFSIKMLESKCQIDDSEAYWKESSGWEGNKNFKQKFI